MSDIILPEIHIPEMSELDHLDADGVAALDEITRILEEQKELEQNSSEWFSSRSGVITAFRAADVVAVTPEMWIVESDGGRIASRHDNENDAAAEVAAKKANTRVKTKYHVRHVPKEYKQTWYTYCYEIVTERICGLELKEKISTSAMKWGHKYEGEAVARYESITGRFCEKTGFHVHPDYPFIGASPDRLIDGGDMLVEVKCHLNPFHHGEAVWEVLKTGKAPEQHWPQMNAQLIVVQKANAVHFLDYDPRFPDATKLAACEHELDTNFEEVFMESAIAMDNEANRLVEQLSTIDLGKVFLI